MSDSTTRSTIREKYCVLIPHPTRAQALVVPAGDGWALPEFLPDHEHPDLPDALQAIRAQLRIDASILYDLRRYERAIPGPLNVFVLEVRTAGWNPPPEGRWIGAEALPDLPMPFTQQRRALQSWLAEAEGVPLPTIGLPWWKPGWLAEVEGWLLPEVRRLGYTPTEPVERLKSFYTSAIVKVPALPADLYLKVMAPPLVHEAALLPMLAQQDPAHFPVVLTSHVEQGWVLMRDMGGQPLWSDVPTERWEEIARTYGELQVAAVPRVESWLALGCRDLRLPRLLGEIDFLVAHVPERLQGLNKELSKPRIIDLPALQVQANKLKQIASELAASGLPPTLEHGDFHASNVQVTEGGCVFYDWSHATLTYPLVGVGDLLYDDDWFPDQPDFADRIRDAYLQPWTAYQPLPQLQAAFRRAQPLRKLYGAIHQGRLIAAHQQRLGGQDYISETPTGNSFEHLQWWFAEKLQALTQMEI
jgi:aminoglycoside phosphotransferase (APT) family kinase protein